MKKIHDYSFKAFYTEVFFRNENDDLKKLGNATSFAYKYRDENYLVTNYHVALGVNPFTKKIISPMSSIPNCLKVFCQIPEKGMMPIIINYEKEDWKTIEKEGQIADIATYKLPENFEGLCINEIEDNEGSELSVTDNLYILGYPKGINIDYTPIWKRATVASEPELPIKEMYFYVDTSTREGMSGAPVVQYSKNSISTRNSSGGISINVPDGRRFVGIYSGRDNNNELEAQLGLVWIKELIEDIINS